MLFCSAVDGSTGEHIFYNGIVGVLKDKLRIVALNSHMHLIRHFDRVIVLEAGVIRAIDTPSALLHSDEHSTLFRSMIGDNAVHTIVQL